MTIEVELKKRLQYRIEDLQTYSIKHFDDAKNDARWYTTLIFAELAGIASYVGSPVSTGLNHYSVVVLILVIALVCFIYASIQAQKGKAIYGKLYARTRSEIREMDADKNITGTDAELKAVSVVEGFSNEKILNRYEIADFFGLILFGLGTALVALFIFLSSLMSIFKTIVEQIGNICTYHI